MELFPLPQFLYAASLLGSAAFALSGFLTGVRKRMDIMGIFILALITANGGGTVRDVLLNRPIALMHDAEPFLVAGLVVAGASLFKLHRLPQLEGRWHFIVSDGIGLVAFSLTGALIGVAAQVHFWGVLALSLLTATGGSMVRDLLVNDIPEVLHGGFYGSIALLVGAAAYGLSVTGLATATSLTAVFGLGLGTRLAAYKLGWRLPKLE